MLQGTPSLRRGLIALQLLLAVLVVAFPMLEAFEIAGSTRTAFASLPLLRAAMAAPTSTRISRQVAHMSSTDDVTASRPKKVILVCTGDACEDVGSRQLLKVVRATAPGELTCKSTGCLGMCGQGPVVGTQLPGGAVEVKRDVQEEDLPAIFADALDT